MKTIPKKGTCMDNKRKQIYNSLMFMGLVGGISNYDSDLDIDFDILDEDSKEVDTNDTLREDKS